MKYLINKTHAKQVGLKLYKAGEIYEGSEIENLDFAIKKGFVSEVKEEKEAIKTKEEKAVKKTKTYEKRPRRKKT